MSVKPGQPHHLVETVKGTPSVWPPICRLSRRPWPP